MRKSRTIEEKRNKAIELFNKQEKKVYNLLFHSPKEDYKIQVDRLIRLAEMVNRWDYCTRMWRQINIRHGFGMEINRG